MTWLVDQFWFRVLCSRSLLPLIGSHRPLAGELLVTITTSSTTLRWFQSMYIQQSSRPTAWLTILSYQGWLRSIIFVGSLEQLKRNVVSEVTVELWQKCFVRRHSWAIFRTLLNFIDEIAQVLIENSKDAGYFRKCDSSVVFWMATS